MLRAAGNGQLFEGHRALSCEMQRTLEMDGRDGYTTACNYKYHENVCSDIVKMVNFVTCILLQLKEKIFKLVGNIFNIFLKCLDILFSTS